MYVRGERCKIRRRFDANPRDAGPPCVRKKSDSAKSELHMLRCMDCAKRGTNLSHTIRRNFTDKFERDMQISRVHPSGPRIRTAEFIDHRRKILTHVHGNRQGHEEAHGLSPFWWRLAVIQKMHAHHVQRGL